LLEGLSLVSAFASSFEPLCALFLPEEVSFASDDSRDELGDSLVRARLLVLDFGDAVDLASGGTVPEALALALGEALAEAPGVADAAGVIEAVASGEADALDVAVLVSAFVLVVAPALVREVVLPAEKLAPADTPNVE